MGIDSTVRAERQREVPPAGGIEFRLLGAVEAVAGGRAVVLGGVKQRALLALFVLHANEVVSPDFLIDGLWGERAPANASHSLVVYVSRLRKALQGHGVEGVLRTEQGGYVLRVDPGQTDVGRFEHALAEGRRALAGGAAGEAAAVLRRGLAEWRGEPLSDVVFEPFAGGEARRLDELRLEALEARIDADLALGRHAEAVGELNEFVRRYPLNERLCGQLMLALYRSGRQAEALQAYQAARRYLVDEFGIEPGTELRRLERGVLRHDRELEAPMVRRAGDGFAFSSAGAPVGRPRRERKTVSVLIAQLAQGGEVDPESLQLVSGECLAAMRWAIERHGGTVERFVGDTVMGIFGVPVVHEDDALRAVRAAADIRNALRPLAETLTREHGVTPELRVGLSTGRVLTGTEGPLVTGAAVGVASELAGVAEPGEIVLAAETASLLGAAVETEPVEPAGAFRFRGLVAIEEDPWSSFVGRKHELALLTDTFRRVCEERELQLFTLLGPAGIGKSRLARVFVDSLKEPARVVRGRCLSYGQAITYLPLVEVLRPLGEQSRLVLDHVISGEASSEELSWTVQRTLEQAAEDQPLLVVLEDLHWAEPTLLDLLDRVCALSRGYPILLLCLARPELLDERPGWAGGKLNATSLLLEPLAREECELLVGALRHPLEPEQRRRVVEVAEGNPLFCEELAAYLAEGGDDGLPPRIEVLLQARLDLLPEPARLLLGCAAVEGTVFHQGSLETLAPDDLRAGLADELAALTRNEIVRPALAEFAAENGFRFRHQLIRDAAYERLPKEERARLHERFADWLETRAGDHIELDEILGYHLDQAAHYKHDLGHPDPDLAERAAGRLAAAGRRALWRDDYPAAVTLLGRALELTRPDRLDIGLEADLAFAVQLGSPPRAAQIAEAAAERAHVAGDEPGEALARVAAAAYRGLGGDLDLDDVERLARRALPLLERAGEHAGLVHVWWVLGYVVANCRGRFEDMTEAFESALHHARLAGSGRHRADICHGAAVALFHGPRPVDQALQRLEQLMSEHPSQFELLVRGGMLAMLGRFDEAWPAGEEASARLGEQSGELSLDWLATMATMEGNHETAMRLWRRHCEELEQKGQLNLLSTMAPELGRSLCSLGRYEEAECWARRGRELGEPGDLATQALWRQVQARAAAHRGRHAQAETLAREAVAIVERTDALVWQGDAFCDLAEVLEAAGRRDEAADALRSALDRYERKGNLAMARQMRDRLKPLEGVSV